jgi:hypothetical protein
LVALAHAAQGALAAAEAQARAAVEVLAGTPPMRAYALAVLARVQLAQGRVVDAAGTAREAHAAVAALGGIDEGATTVRLAYAEALWAAGDTAEARAAITAAAEQVQAAAAKISDPALRRGFVENVSENARTLALAHEWARAPDA